MSTLHTNTVETSSGGPVTLTKQSAAKAWCDIAVTTVAFNDSFGMSSSTDIAVGNYDVSFTNNFSNAYYAPAGNASTGGFSTNTFTNRTGAGEKTSSLYEWSTSNSETAYDLTFNTLIISGDLA